MSDHSASATFTSDFGHEFEAERQSWLRRRFLWYTGTVVITSIPFLVLSVINLALGRPMFGQAVASSYLTAGVAIVVMVVGTAMYAAAFHRVWRPPCAGTPLLRVVYILIVASGVLNLLSTPVMLSETLAQMREQEAAVAQRAGAERGAARDLPPGTVALATPEGRVRAGFPGTGDARRDKAAQALLSAGLGIFQLFFTHIFACLFLPWTRESFRPLLPLLALNALITLCFAVYAATLGVSVLRVAITTAGLIALSPLVGVPGTAVCWWRHSRFHDRFTTRMVRGRYAEMKRELVDARRIHEGLFPEPCTDGPVRFCYRYEPMRQIGGDYLYARFCPREDGPGDEPGEGEGPLSVVVIDVTGHGVPAALTVNRLHGELERIFAESPEVRPGEVLALLNRYVHLTLALHSVYVTAFCLRADPRRGSLEYASGGHPPAFLRAVDGTVEELGSTAFVLGACAAADFHSEPRTVRFGPGDTLVAYTDGATEARNAEGRMLGTGGLQRLVALGKPDPIGGWPKTILKAVGEHRHGPIADDTLVIEVSRPLGGPGPEHARLATRHEQATTF